MRGDGMGRRDQTSAGGNTVPPVSVGNVYHGVMRCVLCQSRLNIFQVCFFGDGKQWNLLLSGFYRGNWCTKNDAIGFLKKQKTSLLRFWHQKIDWGKSDSHIHLIPSPPAETTCWIYGGCYILQSSCDLAYEITCASPVFQHHKVEKQPPHLPSC